LREADNTIKDFIAKPEIIRAFTWLILDAYADSMVAPEIVLDSKSELVEEVVETLESVALKLFKKSDDPNAKLFTKDIITYIQSYGYISNISSKQISTIMLKLNVSRTKNGSIWINGEQAKGYNNVVYVPPTAEENTRNSS
jgi:hypothetical protein